MLDRLIVAFALIVVAFGAYSIGTRWQVARITARPASGDVVSRLRKGIPAVVYFWSETCAPCESMQTPALKQLEAKLGADGVQIVAINALNSPEMASAWGVLSLPTTFIVDRTGLPRHVNHGVARAEQLERQLAALG
jgi:thiol-disulfide isomerase/thioredoxin